MANLLLIESPGKVRKLSQILGPGWRVKASVGHIRELANDGEDSLGFDLKAETVDCRYVPRSPKAKKILSELRNAVKQADAVYIATDPDREGETIGWHLQQALRLKQPHRVVYSEITPAAVRAAIANPRQLDPSLIAAGRARDCLDKLVGYKGSRHVVWPLRNGAKSMGRVQSAALHLICEREREILAFKPEDYWSVWVQYQEGFKAFYRKFPESKTREKTKAKQDQRSEQKTSKSETAEQPESDRITTQAEADCLVELARTNPHKVVSVEGTTKHQSPPPPFITSTLQQATGTKLRFSPERTMKLAQSLYEAGHITYMRTDSVVLASPFKQAVRQYLQQHDPSNVPQRATQHRVAKGAQAAHEAIRPTKVEQTPSVLSAQIGPDEAKLYDLIWNRAIASQCSPARLRKTKILTYCQRNEPKEQSDNTARGKRDLAEAYWEARGQVVEFEGYTRYWNNLRADSQLPVVKPKQPLQLAQAQADQKQTQPPPRYTEPKLIQLMERKGIGRPSTYAPTLKTLRDRTYAELRKGKLVPTPLGLQLDEALGKLLPDLIQPEFTAAMEAKLDEIATSPMGEQAWQRYLTGWHREYFSLAIAQAQRKMGEVLMAQTSTPKSHQTKTYQTKTPQARVHPSDTKPPNIRVGESKTPKSRRKPKRSTVSGTTLDIDSKTSPIACPKCGKCLQKVPSKSKKMKANHFLRCETPGCGTVMFWSERKKAYELPYSQRSPDPANFTDFPCPVCGALLEKHAYEKDGQSKVMLRCSVFERRKGKCKAVAYFQGKSGFWSPKFGVLESRSIEEGSDPSNRSEPC